MRCYFHLVSACGVILDEMGVEVTDLHAAEAEGYRAIQELRVEDNEADDDWNGWHINVTDRSGRVLLSISLEPAPQNQQSNQIQSGTRARITQLHSMLVCAGLCSDWMSLAPAF
jgi:hypothetical protein